MSLAGRAPSGAFLPLAFRGSGCVVGRTTSSASSVSAVASRRILTEKDSQCLSFDGCEELLRGSPLGHIMAGAGRILNSSAGSAKTYALSQAVTQIDTFLSHNWVVGRVLKFAAMAFEFNFNLAVGVTACLALPVSLLSAKLPLVEADYGAGHVLARLTIGPIFLMALLFVRSLWCLRHRGEIVFMDKTCIAQDDIEQKLAGISKLGAYLVKSKCMLILYSPVYLTKLWTVYELACFLSVHPEERLKIRAVSQAMVYLVAVAVFWLWVSAQALAYIFTNAVLAVNVLGFFAAAALVTSQRRWARDKAALFKSMTTFDVRNCTCAVESDREVVYKNIAGLMIAVFGFPSDTDVDVALDNFNLVVRTDLPSAVSASMGRLAFSYKHYVMLGFTFCGSQALDELHKLWLGRFSLESGATLAQLMLWIFCLFPLLLVVSELLGSRLLHLRGCRSAILITAATVLITILASTLHWSVTWCREAAVHDRTMFLIFNCCVVAASATSCIVAGLWSRRRPRSAGGVEQSRPGAALRRSIQAPAVESSCSLSEAERSGRLAEKLESGTAYSSTNDDGAGTADSSGGTGGTGDGAAAPGPDGILREAVLKISL